MAFFIWRCVELSHGENPWLFLLGEDFVEVRDDNRDESKSNKPGFTGGEDED